MIDLEDLYFEWLLTCLDPEGVLEGVAHVSGLLHNCEFTRRVGNDINRAVDGANLRKEFMAQFSDADFDPHVTNDLMMQPCSWFEMLVALSRALDFTYDGGVEGRYIELATNLGLEPMMVDNPHRTKVLNEFDQRFVDVVTNDVNQSNFDIDGHGGLFPLTKHDHPDQREVEIWDQHSAYFRERLEGEMWTSTT